jgi:hypothetical protein
VRNLWQKFSKDGKLTDNKVQKCISILSWQNFPRLNQNNMEKAGGSASNSMIACPCKHETLSSNTSVTKNNNMETETLNLIIYKQYLKQTPYLLL